MADLLQDLRNLLVPAASRAGVGRVTDYDPATGRLLVLIRGEVVVLAAPGGAWRAGDEVVIGADGQVLGRAPSVARVLRVD